MDTQTVLDIIKMIDAQISMNSRIIETDSTIPLKDAEALGEQNWALEQFRDHLQEYIEQQVNQAENNLNAGD